MITYKVVACKPHYYGRPVSGLDELEKLLNNGWEIYRVDMNSGSTTGGFNIYFLSRRG